MNQSKKLDNNFLLPISHVGLPYFRHSDTESLFEKNLKTKPENWKWRDKQIKYTVNSEGYRTTEWQNIKWQNSIIMLGCSHVFGIGVDDKETLSAQLENILKTPVVNLGFPAGGSTNILYNTLRLLENEIKPKAVVCIFPTTGRDVYFYNDHVKNLGAWSTDVGYYTQAEVNYITGLLSEESQIIAKNYINETSCKLLWESNAVPFYGFAHSKEIRFRNWPMLSQSIDRARDDKHHGPNTYANWAREIINCLN